VITYHVESNAHARPGALETEATAKAWICRGEFRTLREARKAAAKVQAVRVRIFKTGATLGRCIYEREEAKP